MSASRASEFEAGEEIAPGLHALEALGGGSRYEAYLAFDVGLHYRVVAKLLRPHLADDPGALRGLRREAEALGALHHPVLIDAFGACLDGPRPHVVLELAEGPRLSTDLRRFGPLDVEQAAPLGVELASAIHAMHRSGFVHLDVKPKNVILGAPPRLIDLSVARRLDEAAALGRPVGTDAYMAPEQCDPSALGPIGPACDVWGIGVTLFEAVAGGLPFARGRADAERLEDRFPQVASRPAPLPDGVAPALAEAIEAALAPRAADRPAPADVADAIEPLLATPPRFRLSRLRPR
jgi:serine/threonine-protein kinase